MKFSVALIFSVLFCGICASLNKNWWRNTEIYDIVALAYKDTDGDGFGDFEGIISKLDYIEGLGAHAIKLSPIFPSSGEISNTYPVEDFQNIHLGLGTLEDFDKLVQEANARGIRIILDLTINHCSHQHEWFKKSQNRIEPFTNYFIWTDGGKNTTTTDTSVYNVWDWDDTRKQYFYHRFDKSTADLNLKNEAVQNEIKNLMKFWLDKGVSGFNLVSANVYMEDEKALQYEYPPSAMLEDTSESYEFVHELREYVDYYNQQTKGDERVLMLEQRPIEKFPNLHGNETYPIAHIVLKSVFERDNYQQYFYLQSSFINETITNIMKELENGPTMHFLEDTTLKRAPNRFYDRQYLDVWMTTILMLPSVIHIYYGQEIGISTWKFEDKLKITAMQWDESINAGFTSNEFSYYAPNVDYWKVNVKNLKETKYSTLHSVQNLLKLRSTKAVQFGDLKTHNISDYVFAFSRSYRKKGFLTIINSSNELYEFDLKRDIPKFQAQKAKIVASTPNSIHRPGEYVGREFQLTLRPVSAIVISHKK